MKKIVFATLLAAVLLVAVPGVAGAAVHRGEPAAKPAFRLGLPAAVPGRVAFAPLGVTLSGTAAINGQVLSYYGNPVSAAPVGWYVSTAEGEGYGDATTDYAGNYGFTGLPAATGNGIVWASVPDGSYELDYLDRTWADPGPTTFNFQPGSIRFELIRGGPWSTWNNGWITLRGQDAGGQVMSFTGIGSSTYPDAWALPGTNSDASVNFWMDEGMEVPAAQEVLAGQPASTTVSADEASSQRIWTMSPYWASGKPGSSVKLRLQNFPYGWVSDFYGYQEMPKYTFKTMSSYTSKGALNESKTVTVPSTAKPGFDYYLGLQHRGGLLSLETPFQVCTLKGPTAARSSYKLTGVIPIQGYTGAPGDTGHASYVYLYKRYTTAGQPKGDPTKFGWKFVRRYRTNGVGKFTTGYLPNTRTTYWVVFYPGDDWYWGAFTSVKKVRHY